MIHCAGPTTVSVLGGGPPPGAPMPAELALRVQAAAATLGCWQREEAARASFGSHLARMGSRVCAAIEACADVVRAVGPRPGLSGVRSMVTPDSAHPAEGPVQPPAPPLPDDVSDGTAAPAVGIPTSWMPHVGMLRPAELDRRARLVGVQLEDLIADRVVPRSVLLFAMALGPVAVALAIAACTALLERW